MDTAELMARIMRAKNQQLCPECGGKMVEADRACENGIIFIWYKCSTQDCSGQWLQKTAKKPEQVGVAVSS